MFASTRGGARTAPVVPPPPSATAPGATTATPTSARASAPPGGWKTIHAVELHASDGPLRAQLAGQARAAKAAGETVLVQTVAPSSEACAEILRAMGEPAVQHALARVRLVRVDALELHADLAPLHMSEPSVPWFYLIDVRGSPRDAISADEWDDNSGPSMAPVLDAFVHGALPSRRVAWRGVTSL
jgi:hypothetical protein